MQRISLPTVKPGYSHTKNVSDLLSSLAKEQDSKSLICTGSSGIDDPVIRIRTESLDPEGRHLVLSLYSVCLYYVRHQICGSGTFYPGSRVKKISDPRSASKNLNIFNPKTVSKLSKKYLVCSSPIRIFSPSRIRIFFPSRIRIFSPSRIRNTVCHVKEAFN